ncbi:hypothetical protein FOL47_003368, partial [Perkinsus chesapeaki]
GFVYTAAREEESIGDSIGGPLNLRCHKDDVRHSLPRSHDNDFGPLGWSMQHHSTFNRLRHSSFK